MELLAESDLIDLYKILESDRDNKRAVRFSRKLNYICFHCRSVNTPIIDRKFS